MAVERKQNRVVAATQQETVVFAQGDHEVITDLATVTLHVPRDIELPEFTRAVEQVVDKHCTTEKQAEAVSAA